MAIVFQLQARLSQSNPSPKVKASCLCNHPSSSIPVQNSTFLEVDGALQHYVAREWAWITAPGVTSLATSCLGKKHCWHLSCFSFFHSPRFCLFLSTLLSIWKNRRPWYEEAVSSTHSAKPHTCAKLFTINSCLTFSVCEFCTLWAAVELNFNREGGC